MYRILSKARDGTGAVRRLVSYSSCARGRLVHCHGNSHGYGSRYYGYVLRCQGHSMARREYSSAASAEPFLSGTSGTYIEAMYESWKVDRTSVHKVSAEMVAYSRLVINELFIPLGDY